MPEAPRTTHRISHRKHAVVKQKYIEIKHQVQIKWVDVEASVPMKRLTPSHTHLHIFCTFNMNLFFSLRKQTLKYGKYIFAVFLHSQHFLK